MIKCNSTDVVFDLQGRWRCLIDDAWDNEFDYEFFKILAAHTFSYLFELNKSRTLPSISLAVLFAVKEFSVLSCGGISDEYEAAKIVAQEFCNQMEECWVETEDGLSEDVFVVGGPDGVDCLIDTNTFDLAELVESFCE